MEVGLCWIVVLDDWSSEIGMAWLSGEDDE